ncbi:hypothetical protein HMPREF1255_0244 [Propionimicrobium sp. BV2F7]|nr:hypothetical protein HMPREF1255_0244 [Propionimicrobium sp. BV2F7]
MIEMVRVWFLNIYGLKTQNETPQEKQNLPARHCINTSR